MMKKLIQVLGLVATIWTVGVAPGFAGVLGLRPGGGAPSPEIGASVLGLLLAGGVAFYIRGRRRG